MGIEQKPPPRGEEHAERPLQVDLRRDVVAFVETIMPDQVKLHDWQRELLRKFARMPARRLEIRLPRGGRRW